MPRLEALEDRTVPSTFTVGTLAESGPGSLRQAILDANAQPGDDTINFSVTGAINLSSALPNLSTNLAIQGPGAASLTVQRSNAGGTPDFRILTVSSGATVALSGLTIARGRIDLGISTGPPAQGGGIYNGGTLTVSNCKVADNFVWSGDGWEYGLYPTGSGGGIFNMGALTVRDSTLSSNTANLGGGIYSGGVITVSNSTISGNAAVGKLTGWSLEVFDGMGGGIYNDGTATVSDSTLSGNWTTGGILGGGGGGISNHYGTVTLNNATVSGNSAGFGGGIVNYGTVTARNTILAGNTAPTCPDLCDSLHSLGYNLIGNTSGSSGYAPTDLLNVNPLLGPLQDNGGSTQTMALLAGSPALNAGDPDQLGVADQRGVLRSGGVNIGTYQASATAFALTGVPDSAVAGTPLTVTVTAQDRFGQTARGYQGTDRFASADGQADLPGDYTFVAADNGVHTITDGVTLKTAGSQSITATDTDDSSLIGSATVAVTPAAADHLLLIGRGGAAAGVPFDLVVTIQDRYGNTVTGYAGTVTFATNDPDGTLPGDYIFTAEDAGAHLFVGGVTLYADGSRITVTDTELDTLTGSVVITFG
jgi:hypothetical protein